MSEDGGPPVKRLRLIKEDVEKLSREDLIQRLLEQDSYIESLQNKTDGETGGDDGRADPDDKLKQQQVDATRKENVLVMRLTTKEQEVQEYLNQIQELKQTKNPGTTQLRAMLLDPAINLMFQRMCKEVDSYKEKLEQAQNDLAAWKFTSDSQTGKRLMAKCKMLLQENEELGKVISAGRTAKLEGEIALQKRFVDEMKKSQAETDEFLVEMDEDLEGMQSTIYFLQQQLKDTKDQLSLLREENQQLRQQQQQQPQPHQVAHSFLDKDSNLPIPQKGKDSPNAVRDRDSEIDTPTDRYSPDFEPHSVQVDVDSQGIYDNTDQSATRTANRAVILQNTNNSNSNNDSAVRTSNDDNVVSSSSPTYTSRPAYVSQQEKEPHNVQDSKHLASSANGSHIAMETDLSDEPQSSCDGGSTQRHVQDDCEGNASPDATLSHVQYNHAPCRTSNTSDGTLQEAADVTSETWSPSNQSKIGDVGSEEDQQQQQAQEKYRTENKGTVDKLQNGLLSKQYEAPESEMAN